MATLVLQYVPSDVNSYLVQKLVVEVEAKTDGTERNEHHKRIEYLISSSMKIYRKTRVTKCVKICEDVMHDAYHDEGCS